MSAEAFLGVEQSLTGRRWTGLSAEEDRLSEAMMQQTGQPPAVCRTLVRRGVVPEDAAAFLEPRLRDLLPDPLTLKDAGKAAERLVAAVSGAERIAVFADYDVDGGSSAALLIDWMRALGRAVTLYVPDRIDEGYGPNEDAIAALADGHDLIVCVDCGTLSHGPLAAAGDTDVLVLDHHLGGDTLPPALAVVNPNRIDETGELGHLCAAAVVFLVLVEANRQLRASNRSGPDLMAMLDLVALATVADVAPLTGVNRAFVRQGLKVMAERQRVGLTALSDCARIDQKPSAYHLGYVLGPRINAGGRIGQADLGARLLATADVHEATALSERLETLNAERREIETQVRLSAIEQAENRGTEGPLVWAAGDGWHPGVVGIVASRLKEHANRPAVVIGFDGDVGKGSGRSVSGVDLGASIQRLAAEGLIAKGGGHKMAAGLTLSRDQLPAAMARLGALLGRQGSDRSTAADMQLDGVLACRAVTPELIAAVDATGPFGAGAPAPRYAIADARIRHARPVGEAHLKLTLADADGTTLDAIAFGAFDGPLGPTLSAPESGPFHLAGRLELNHWNGRSIPQLRLEDAAPATG